ncbi:MAG: peptide-methionine (R)-S-oxide reductase MsrB [Myxococcales bacterium]|nr:MAG: peptide-methionine (R)-S-oxide reductase MsrB [Myxococcales bacterium]
MGRWILIVLVLCASSCSTSTAKHGESVTKATSQKTNSAEDQNETQKEEATVKTPAKAPSCALTDEEWKEKLSPEEYAVLRDKGTERAFSGKYYKHKESGIYHCAACGEPLFSSDTKYDSGSGWPSFFKPVSEDAVRFERDASHGMVRTEVICGNCGSHLGHVFDDGPKPTGQRYCINSVSLGFSKATDKAK